MTIAAVDPNTLPAKPMEPPNGVATESDISRNARKTGREQDKLRVFISYSRDDLDFADQLEAALRLYGFQVVLDRHGISGGEDWKRRLGNLILETDTVVFVLSPSSARSEICAWEVEEATRLGKRILPIVCRPLDGAQAPARLGQLNYIFFHAEPKVPGSGFGTGLSGLVTALDTDLDWLRAHSRYQQRATEWDAGGRPTNRLLSGGDIAEAKAWIASKPKSAPEPTALQLDFVRASEDEAAARTNAERQQLQAMAAAQAERAKALEQAELALRQAAEAQRRRVQVRNVALGVVSLLAILSGALGWHAERQRQLAEAQRKSAVDVVATATELIYTLQRKVKFDDEANRERLAIFQRGAELGVAQAMHNLGLIYGFGTGTKKDYTKAREWLEKAAAAGDIDVMTDLGSLYEEGLGVARDPAKAREIYQKGVALGDPGAANTLGVIYWSGRGVPQDFAKAKELYEKSAAGGNNTAMFNLGVLYRFGQGVPLDLDKAREWNEKAAAKGNSAAMLVLGVMHETGGGAPLDYAKAREWYEKAAALEDAGGMNNLGLMLEKGLGVETDLVKAREWFEKAAALGDVGAMVNLGIVYLEGKGVPRDPPRARDWFEKAAGLGRATAMRNLATLYEAGDGIPQDLAKAREWNEKGAAAGDAETMARYAVMLANGTGGPGDDNKAREWLERAASLGNVGSMHNLGIFIANGRGTAKDDAKAREWFAKAAAAGHADARIELERTEIRLAVAAGNRAEVMRLQEARAARLEAAETKRFGKPGPDTASALMSAAWEALFAREPARSLAMSERALTFKPGDKHIETNRAHALMQLGRLDEARAVYLIFRDGADERGKPWKTIIAEDFAELRKAGLPHPFMAQVEATLGIVTP